MDKAGIDEVAFNSDGLVPAIATCARTGKVLMMAWMSRESLALTLETGRVTYFSRSRRELWEKGLTSGNTQSLVSATLDCDGDTILLEVEQKGPACHTGEETCFFRPLVAGGET